MKEEERLKLIIDTMLVSYQLSHDVIVFLQKMLADGVIPPEHAKGVADQIRDSMIKGKAIMEAWEVLNKP